MDVVDESGRLFGVVNVVDAVAVLLVVAVVAAGASLALSGGSAEPEPDPDRTTRNVTVSFGVQPDYVAGLVEPGNVTVDDRNVTITDVYRTPAGDARALVLARVQVLGRQTESGFVVGDTTVRHGLAVTFESPTYQLRGLVRTVGGDATFDTAERTVTVEANVSDSVAGAVSPGDTHRIADTEVAMVREVDRLDGNGERTTIRVRLRVTAREHSGATYYGGAPLRLGTELNFETARYEFEGRVVGLER